MLRVYGCIAEHHNLSLVVLAGLICFISCYTALSLTARIRPTDGKILGNLWLIGAMVVTGCGIWATHFVAMLGFQSGLPIAYDIGWTVLSALVAILASGLGYLVAIHGRQAALGGAIVGAAISAMHYIGMAAVRLPAREHWDTSYVIASLLIGIGFGAASLHLARCYRGIRGRLAEAFLLTLGICGMHFTGMASLSYSFDPAIVIPQQTISPIWFSVAITAITLLIVGLGLTASLVDQYVAKLASALADANAANRAKLQFLATMSHELRTPLNAIIGFSDVMKMEMFEPLSARYCEYAGNIFDSGCHLLSLINDVLDITKLDENHLELTEEVVDLAQTVSTCVKFTAPQAVRAKVTLHIEAEPGLPRIYADERRLRQILLNLMSNAVKFTHEGGLVHVTVSRQSDGILFVVADTGIGIAPEDIATAFERFGQIDSRLSRKYEGTGLGLPLAKHLIELHGGTLEMTSKVGLGTVVKVRFGAERIIEETPVKLRA